MAQGIQDRSRPQLPALILSDISRRQDEVSPITSPILMASSLAQPDSGDVSPVVEGSGISAFDPHSRFDFGFPTSDVFQPDGGPLSPSPLNPIQAYYPSTGTPPPFPSPKPLLHPTLPPHSPPVSPSAPPFFTTQMPTEPEHSAEPPPPYSRYAGRHVLGGPPGSLQWNPVVPASAYTQQTPPTSSRSHSMTDISRELQGGSYYVGCRSAAQRSNSWKGLWFCPADGTVVSGKHPNSPKGHMSRAKKWCMIGAFALIVVITAAVLGGVFATMKTRSKVENMPSSSSSSQPTLPTGTFSVRPFRGADSLTTCIIPSYQWSCVLPPDTTFPVTTATNDNFRVPEFIFTIAKQDPASPPSGLQRPVPTDVPSATDYQKLADVDGIQDTHHPEGEQTHYYISLKTSTNTDPNLQPRAIQIREESHTLPKALNFQPLRLFDRGLPTEHFGFHVYFLKTVQFADDSQQPSSGRPDTGGVTAADAGYRVEWHNTRFQVKIFTSSGKGSGGSDGNGGAMVVMSDRSRSDELTLPVEIWEDRANGGKVNDGQSITSWILDSNGYPVVEKPIIEKTGLGTDPRGCYCRWGNFAQS